jgi:uroporphyrinogen decarboxylase
VEGGSSKTFGLAKRLIYDTPELAHRLLDKLADAVTDYLNAQIEAGAQAVQIFDTWGGVLAPEAFREFSLAYMARIVERLTREHEGRRVPVILFSKGSHLSLEAQADTGCDALGVDWTLPLSAARARVGGQVALQGNLDPAVLLAGPDVIRAEVTRCLRDFGPGSGHVFNLGHGITPDVDPDHLQVLIRTVAEVSPELH